MLFENIRELYTLYKKPINLTLLVIAISFIIYIFVSFKVVIFTPKDTSGAIKIYGYDINTINDVTKKPVELAVSSINIVPRSVNYFEVTGDNKASIIGEHALKFYSPLQTFDVTLASQKKLEKKYTGPFNCLAGTAKNLNSYSCTNPDYIFNYQTTSQPWGNTPVTRVTNERSLVPYKNGLLGIRHLSGVRYDKPLVYTDLTNNTKTHYALPSEISADLINTSSIIPDDKNPDILLIASHEAKIFYVVDISSNRVVKKIDYPKDYDSNDGISCRVHDSIATCFVGKSTQSLDSHDENEAQTTQQYHSKTSTLMTFPLENGGQVTSQLLDSSLYIKEIYKTDSGNIYGLNESNTLIEIHSDGTTQIIARGVESVGVANQLFFTRANQLYTLKEETLVSEMSFESENNVSRVQSFDNEIYVSMFATNNIGQTTSNLYTYKLTDTAGDNKQSLAILSLNKLQDVQAVDYNGSDIFIHLRMPVLSDKETGKTIYNATLRQAAVTHIESELNKLPINKADYRIIYYPSL